MDYLKQNGSRLGGMTGQYFLRRTGRETFLLSKDVVRCLQEQGVDIKDMPSSKKDLRVIQEAFNQLHQDTGFNYTNLSRIMAFSVGENYAPDHIEAESNRFVTLNREHT